MPTRKFRTETAIARIPVDQMLHWTLQTLAMGESFYGTPVSMSDVARSAIRSCLHGNLNEMWEMYAEQKKFRRNKRDIDLRVILPVDEMHALKQLAEQESRWSYKVTYAQIARRMLHFVFIDCERLRYIFRKTRENNWYDKHKLQPCIKGISRTGRVDPTTVTARLPSCGRRPRAAQNGRVAREPQRP